MDIVARNRIFLLAGLLSLAGCATPDFLPGRSQAAWYARNAGWSYEMIDTGSFFLATAQAPGQAGQRPLTVYVEGDGRAFVGDRTPSADPTPAPPIALRLAMAHTGPVAWVGRPCQFTDTATARHCQAAYWSSHRYAPEVVESIGQAVDELKRRSGAHTIIMAGYSGGGAVAALLAARRSDVVGLVTVSANLDLAYWVKHDKLAPLPHSLDPADDAERLRTVPQVHFTGGRDDIVSPEVTRSYLSRLGMGSPARMMELAEFDHRCCWVASWPALVRRPDLSIIPGWN